MKKKEIEIGIKVVIEIMIKVVIEIVIKVVIEIVIEVVIDIMIEAYKNKKNVKKVDEMMIIKEKLEKKVMINIINN